MNHESIQTDPGQKPTTNFGFGQLNADAKQVLAYQQLLKTDEDKLQAMLANPNANASEVIAYFLTCQEDNSLILTASSSVVADIRNILTKSEDCFNAAGKDKSDTSANNLLFVLNKLKTWLTDNATANLDIEKYLSPQTITSLQDKVDDILDNLSPGKIEYRNGKGSKGETEGESSMNTNPGDDLRHWFNPDNDGGQLPAWIKTIYDDYTASDQDVGTQSQDIQLLYSLWGGNYKQYMGTMSNANKQVIGLEGTINNNTGKSS